MTPQKIIEVAKAELGYIGKKSNAELDNPTANITGKYTKYARDLFNAGYYNGNKNGYNWCAVFVDWCFWKACDEDKVLANTVKPVEVLGAGVTYAYNGLKNLGRISDVPIAGAQVFYDGHTGLVEYVTDTDIHTIEGNWDNKVTRRTVSRKDSRIIGYGIPYYDADDVEPPVQFERGDIVQIKEGVTTNYAGVKLASWVYDGRPLYVIESDYELTKITVDPELTSTTATMNTCDLYQPENEGTIIFINNEDAEEADDMVTIPTEEYLDLLDAREFRDSFKAILSTLK